MFQYFLCYNWLVVFSLEKDQTKSEESSRAMERVTTSSHQKSRAVTYSSKELADCSSLVVAGKGKIKAADLSRDPWFSRYLHMNRTSLYTTKHIMQKNTSNWLVCLMLITVLKGVTELCAQTSRYCCSQIQNNKKVPKRFVIKCIAYT